MQLIFDSKFDVERVKHCADVYSNSVGVGCIVIDAAGDTIYDACKMKQCEFCKMVQKLSNPKQTCHSAHLYGSYQAERFGGRYIFFCPYGLVHWASPVMVDGILNGALLGGPVLMVEPEEFLLEDILRLNHLDDMAIEGLKKHINEIPIVNPEIVSSMSEMLFMTALYASEDRSYAYQEDMEFHEQQSEISEYIHHIKTMGSGDDEAEGYPVEKEKELLSLISLGDKAGSQKILNEVLGYIFFSTGGHFELIRARILELAVLLSRAALEGGADVEQIFGLNYKYLTQIHEFKTIDQLSFWLSGIMTRFTDCVFNLTNVKHIDVIYKAVDYIKRNYMKKITLDEVASHVYLSTSYFCAIFKQEMNCSFNNYLNRVRIEMSKRLMMDEGITLVEVANLVGYEDQSYFSKVFKNHVGVSPGKFRERRGQLRT